MDLKEFVQEAIVQIAAGVKGAQDNVRSLGAIVNPAISSVTEAGGAYFGTLDEGHHVFLANFDVAVSVTQTSGTEGGGKLSVATVFNVGGSGHSVNTSATSSRLSFKVPVALPLDEAMRNNLAAERAREDAAIRGRHPTGGY